MCVGHWYRVSTCTHKDTDTLIFSRNKTSNQHTNAKERAAERQDAAQDPPLGTPQALEQQARARENEKEDEDGLAARGVRDHGWGSDHSSAWHSHCIR